MKWEKSYWFVLAVVLVVIVYYNLISSIPTMHTHVMKENTRMKLELQQRMEGIHDKSDCIDHSKELESCENQLRNVERQRNNLELMVQRNNDLSDPSVISNPITVPGPVFSSNFESHFDDDAPLPILILCHNRVDYLKRTLDNILELNPSLQKFPIIVSQDGTHKEVWEVINSPQYYDKVVGIQLINRGTQPKSYHYIAQHFKFAIGTVLDKLQFSDVVILEDDMLVAPDFFHYFLRMRKLLREDKTLYTASAWNDNGQNEHGRDGKKLKRSDFFPGLGWIMTKDLWNELGPKWPPGYWDDWMREPEQRKGRHCIFPEISRSWTFGEQGSSAGQFWKQYLEPVKLYDGPIIQWDNEDLSYLDNDTWLWNIKSRLANAVEISSITQAKEGQSVILTYTNDRNYEQLAKSLNIMYDEKAGIHRTAYKGVVYFWKGSNEVYLAPSDYKVTFGL